MACQSTESRTTLIAVDHRAPLVIDIHELARRPGTMLRLRTAVPAPADLSIGGVVGVPEGADLELDLRFEAVVEGVLVSGTARAPVTGECVRCLDPIEDDLLVEIQELYAYPDRAELVGDAEQQQIEDDRLDLEPTLRDAVVLALPQAPVCRVDCPGLCVECGARLADDPGHEHRSADPRWAVLGGLLTETEPGDDRAPNSSKTVGERAARDDPGTGADLNEES